MQVRTSAAAVWRIGQNESVATRYLNGNLDDLQLRTVALSATEVAQLYNFSRQVNDPTLNWVKTSQWTISDIIASIKGMVFHSAAIGN